MQASLLLINGMYSYGWRDYMPDLGRWNGIDQLAESYLSTSTYAYVANNPISNTDPDGRWIYEDGSIGQAPSTWSMLGPKYKPYLSYSTSDGMGYNSGAGVSGAYSFTGNDAATMFNYFANRGNMSGITFKNGWAMWGTLEGNPFLEGYDGDMYLSNTGSVTLHRAWFGNITDLGSFWKPSSTTTFAGVTSLIMENPFIKAENTMYHTKGNAGVSNIDYRIVRNINTGKQNNLVSMQLNLSYLNLYNELTAASDTNGFMISIGNYSFGASGTLSFDLINSDVSLNFGQKMDKNTTSVNSYGIKPLTAAMFIVGYVLQRFTPPTVVPILPSGGITNNNLIL